MIRTMTAQAACDALDIQPATLYAYVSRGLVRSVTQPDSRSKAYLAEDIDKLLAKKALRHAPESAALQSLDWGLPVLDSEVSGIAEGQLRYRGQALAEVCQHSLEDLIRLLWQTPEWTWVELPARPAQVELPLAGLGGFEQLQLQLLWAGTQDVRAFDLSEEGILNSSSRILQAFFGWVSGQPHASDLLGHFAGLDPRRRELLRHLLIVCADHELNTSTFTARCVASARSTPYAAITAALAALEGLRHGGSTRRTEALLQSCEQAPSVAAGLRRWQQQGETLPGCGHRLYPNGDPRWQILAGLFQRDFASHPAWQLAQDMLAAFTEMGLPEPNVDFGLAVASRILAWPHTEPLVWFALGRVIGWLAHIQEQYRQELLIRPRARGRGLEQRS